MQFQNGGYAALGDGFALPTAYWDTNYQYSGNLTWTHGAHTFKFGASLLRRDWSTFQVLFKANFNINSAQTSSTGAAGGTGGNAIASLLTGYYNQATRNMALASPQYRAWEIGDYIQDNWRVSHNLTLNLGLRYDIYTPIKEKNNALSNFDPTDPATLASGRIQVAGAQGVSDTVNIATQWGDVQPRIGFAWTLGTGFVLRGGFGTSYWPNNVASPANLKNAPMVANYTINQPTAVTTKISDPVPVIVANSVCVAAICGASTLSAGYTPSGFSIGAGTQLPYHNTTIYMTNLTLEKEIWGNVISVGVVAEPVRNLGRVVGNIATNLPPNGPGGCNITMGLNLTASPGLGSPCLPYSSTLPLVGSIQLLETNGVSNYTAMQVVFQRRYKAGLTLNANYTLSRSLSDVGGTGGACTGCAQVLNNFGRDYGPSDFMSKNRFNVAVSYELPFAKSRHGFAAQVAKGWSVNGIFFYASGQPFTVLDGTSNQGSFGITTDRPNVVTGQGFTQSTGEWFDITQFARQPFGTVGTEGHNDFTGPHQVRMDFSIFKDFAIREGVRLQFRAEAFNLTNTPMFGLPNSTISGLTSSGVPTSAGNFGVITTDNVFYTPRDIQFALKLIF
jgi:hypothetical protein